MCVTSFPPQSSLRTRGSPKRLDVVVSLSKLKGGGRPKSVFEVAAQKETLSNTESLDQGRTRLHNELGSERAREEEQQTI